MSLFYKSSTNSKGRQPVHPKAGDFLFIRRKPQKQCKVAFHNLHWGNSNDDCKGSKNRRWCNVCFGLGAQRTSPGNWALGSPVAAFWQSAQDAWPWNLPCSMFHLILNLGLWIVLPVQCVTDIQVSGVHLSLGFLIRLSKTPRNSPRFFTALSWNLSLDRLLFGAMWWGFFLRATRHCESVSHLV